MKKFIFSTLSVLLLAMGSLAQGGTLPEGVAGLKTGMTVNEAEAVLTKLSTKAPPNKNCRVVPELGPNFQTCEVTLSGAIYREIPMSGFILSFNANRLQSVGARFKKPGDVKTLKTQSDALTTFYTGRLGKPEWPHTKNPNWTLDDGSFIGVFSYKDEVGVILIGP